MRACTAWVFTVFLIGGCGGGDSPGPLGRALSTLRGAFGGQKTVASDLVGRWVAYRSVRSDSGLKVPSNLKVFAEVENLKPPPNLKPSADSVVVFPRRVIQSALIAFGKEGVFRDPSGQVAGDGLYSVTGDSVRITGSKGTMVFSIERSRLFSESLTWSDNDRRQTGLVMMRAK